MYIGVRGRCMPMGTSEFIKSVWYEIYWTGSIWRLLLGCSVHSQRSESYWQVELYLKRYFSPLLQRPFAITAHPLPLKSELIWHWVALKSSTVPEGRTLLGGGNMEKMWSVQLSLGVLTILTMTAYVPSAHGEPFLLQGKLEHRLDDTGRWLPFCFAACHGHATVAYPWRKIK